MNMMIMIVALVFVGMACYLDIRWSRIPNLLTIPTVFIGAALNTAVYGLPGLLSALYGLAVGFILMLVLFMCKAVGAGDVKLFAALGSLTGMPFTVQSIMYSLVFAGIIAAGILAYQQWMTYRRTSKKRILQFPFMYAVLPGVCAALYDLSLG